MNGITSAPFYKSAEWHFEAVETQAEWKKRIWNNLKCSEKNFCSHIKVVSTASNSESVNYLSLRYKSYYLHKKYPECIVIAIHTLDITEWIFFDVFHYSYICIKYHVFSSKVVWSNVFSSNVVWSKMLKLNAKY
jgi:hypothetical protein